MQGDRRCIGLFLPVVIPARPGQGHKPCRCHGRSYQHSARQNGKSVGEDEHLSFDNGADRAETLMAANGQKHCDKC